MRILLYSFDLCGRFLLHIQKTRFEPDFFFIYLYRTMSVNIIM